MKKTLLATIALFVTLFVQGQINKLNRTSREQDVYAEEAFEKNEILVQLFDISNYNNQAIERFEKRKKIMYNQCRKKGVKIKVIAADDNLDNYDIKEYRYVIIPHLDKWHAKQGDKVIVTSGDYYYHFYDRVKDYHYSLWNNHNDGIFFAGLGKYRNKVLKKK